MSISPSGQAPAPSQAPDFRELLRRHGIRPDKRLGQHFLFERAALEKVVGAAELSPQDTVLEIGAGVGSLTLCLAAKVARVVAVEVDARLLPALRAATADCANVRLIEGDILAIDLDRTFVGTPYLVVANIPYAITSLLIRRLLEAPAPAARLVITVQREVAERVVAGAGEMSLLALSVQVYGRPRIAGILPAGAFYPPPRVDSAILRIDRHAPPLLGREQVPLFFALARAGFGQKRKKLRNALSAGPGVEPGRVVAGLQRVGLAPNSRAQELTLEAWIRLTQVAQEEGWLTT
ncbi:MAG: 16S rRNA (adenine(1518)-N(6)/adenine(1519)-N(6))-dimethyltransferase RsmA [Chloroflexota bacterium]